MALLFGSAAFLLVKFTNQDAIKLKLSKVVQQKTGRQLTINGQVEVAFFPWLGVKIKDVELSNAPIFRKNSFAHIAEIDAKIRLWPLFSGQVEIGEFVLNNVELSLLKNKAGYNNWQDLIEAASFSIQPSSATSKYALTSIGTMAIKNGHIAWENKQTQQQLEITDFSLSSNDVVPGKPFTVQSSFKISNREPAFSGTVNLQGEVTLDPDNKQYTFHALKVSGSVNNKVLEKTLNFSGNADVLLDLNQQTLALNDLHFKLDNLEAVGSAKGVAIIDAPKFAGGLTIAPFDATGLLQALGFVIKSDVWQKTAFKLTFETTSKFVKFPIIAATIGDMNLKGSGSYSHFDDKLIVFNLDVNKIDVNNLLLTPVAAPATATKGMVKKFKVKAVTPQKVKEPGMAFAILQAVKLNGDLSVGLLRVNKLNFSNVHMAIEGDHGLLTVDPVTANWFNGKLQGVITADVRSAIPRLKMQSTLGGVPLQRVLVDFANFDKVTGVLAISSVLTASGNSGDALAKSLAGNGKLIIDNGNYNGFDLGYQVRRAHAMINQKPMPQETKPAHTYFGHLTSSFNLSNAVISTKDLDVRAPDFYATGQGSVNLNSQALNFRLNAYTPNDKNFFVPVDITGTLANPEIRPDVSSLVHHVVEGAIKEQIQKQIQKQLDKQGDNKNLQQNILKALPLDKLLQNR